MEDPTNHFLSPFLQPQTEYDLHSEMRSIVRFRRALRKEDQDVLDDLLVSMNKHWHLRDQMEHLTPLEFMLLGMLVEQNKEIKQLTQKADKIKMSLPER